MQGRGDQVGMDNGECMMTYLTSIGNRSLRLALDQVDDARREEEARIPTPQVKRKGQKEVGDRLG
jgi:hypothetical protein